MTLDEKRTKINKWCDESFEKHGDDCEGCHFDHDECWCHNTSVSRLTEPECDEILLEIAEIEGKCKKAVAEVDLVNHPPHYTHGGMECIDEMILVFGEEAVANFCVCNAWKYRKRAPFKGNPEEDMKKSDWYMAKYKELKEGA